MRPRRSVAITANQLNLAELRAYARRTGGPDTYDRAALINHIHNHNNNDHDDDDESRVL